MGLDCNSNKEINHDRHTRIESDVIFERNSLIIAQNFCVNTTVGGEPHLVIEENSNAGNEQQLMNAEESSAFFMDTEMSQGQSKPQDYTLIYAAPGSPINAPLLMTIIARNLSDNDVLVSMEDEDEVMVEEIVPAHSELALSAQNACFIRALALSCSQVQFFISVYHPMNLYR